MARWGFGTWGSGYWGAILGQAVGSVKLLSRAVSAVNVSVLRSNVLRLECRFERSSAFTDPNVVTLRLKGPDAAELSLVPERVSPGLYRYDFDTEGMPAGSWRYRWEGDGGVDAAVEGGFEVLSGQF